MKKLFEENRIRQLESELADKIANIPPDTPPLKLVATKLRITYEGLVQLKEYVRDHAFPDKATEVRYFKQLAPPLYCEYFFYSKWMHVELQRATGIRPTLNTYIRHELKGIELFFTKYSRLLCYESTGDTSSDDKFFVKGQSEIWMPEELAPFLDETCCLGSYLLAQLRAHERYRKELEALLHNEEPATSTTPVLPPLFKWTGNKSDLVELIIGLTEDKKIEIQRKPATQMDLKTFFEKQFQIDLRDFYILDVTNRERKRAYTPFLHRLIEKYEKRRNKLLE